MRYLMCALVLIGGLALPAMAESLGENKLIENQRRAEALKEKLRTRTDAMFFDLSLAAKNARAGHPTNMKILYGKGSARRQKIMETLEAYEKAMIAAGINPKDARYRAQARKESMLSLMEPPPCK